VKILETFESTQKKVNFVEDVANNKQLLYRFIDNPKLIESWKVLSDAGETGLSGRIKDIEFLDDYLKKNPKKTAEQVTGEIKSKDWQKWSDDIASIDGNLSFADKSKLFIKNENALLIYTREDGTFFMQRSPSNKNLSTGLSNEVTFSFKYKNGPNATSKDVFGKIGLTDDGYLVGNLKKPTGMNNQQIRGVSEDALDMALHHFGGDKVKGIKALWVENADLYPNLPGNKSINLTRFEEALKTMGKNQAVFETITGKYAKSRRFNKILEVKELRESIDGVNGYEVIFGK
jgi:hypothetical protein